MLAYRIIGWYPNIDPRRRSSSNLSDGAIFSALPLAQDYAANRRMHVLRIATIEKLDDDPEVDHLIKSGNWTPTPTENP
jgi:hypothetical protein